MQKSTNNVPNDRKQTILEAQLAESDPTSLCNLPLRSFLERSDSSARSLERGLRRLELNIAIRDYDAKKR